jgi:hypothetical protein
MFSGEEDPSCTFTDGEEQGVKNLIGNELKNAEAGFALSGYPGTWKLRT